MSEWISVKDKLPITEESLSSVFDLIEVIIYSPTHGVTSEWFKAGRAKEYWSSFDSIYDATHWQALPPPPTE